MISTDLRLGYYKVGQSLFSNKIPALIESTRTGHFPQWIFLNDLLDKHDWKTRPTNSLSNLYKKRCQDLRNRYNYLTLSYSAGADSENILMTFLDNNIRLDEISVVYAVQQAESRPVDPNNNDVENWYSEWPLTIKPRLEWIAKTHPEIKITIRDWMKQLDHNELHDEYMFGRSSLITPYAETRWHDKSLLDRLNRKKGALIFGADNPRLCIKDGWYHIYFVDDAVHSNMPVIDDFTNQVELFYWSPETLDLMSKQCHALIDFFESSAELQHILNWPINSQFVDLYRSIMKKVIYQHLDYRLFQVNKHSHDIPIYGTYLEKSYLDSKKRAWNNLQQALDKKFLSSWNNSASVIGMINGMWPIRPVSSDNHREAN